MSNTAKIRSFSRLAVFLGIFLGASLASEAGAATLTVNSQWGGPVVITGGGFPACPDVIDVYPNIVTVQIIDPTNGVVIASHNVKPGACRYNTKLGTYYGGGTISTSFSVTEIGEARHQQCASLIATATSNNGGSATAYFWLPTCLN